MRINHNIASLNTYRQLSTNSANTNKSIEKLSSGLRINRAGDDAAGLAISEKMRGQIRGLDMASKNGQDGISLIQTAEGALNETHSILQRMRELAVQSSNDTNTTDDRAELQKEIAQLIEEVDRIGDTTEFNTKKLLNGGAGIKATQTTGTGIQVTGGTGKVVAGGDLEFDAVTKAQAAQVVFDSTAALTIGSAGANISINGVTVSLAAGTTGTDIAADFNAVTGQTGVTAAYDATNFTLTFSTTGVGSANTIDIKGITLTSGGNTADTFASGAQVTMVDNDGTDLLTTNAIAGTTVTTTAGDDAEVTLDQTNTTGGTISYSSTGNKVTIHGGDFDGLELDVSGSTTAGQNIIHIDANNSMNFQIGANEGQNMSVTVQDMRATALGIDSIDVTSAAGANSAITTLDNAIKLVSGERSKLGAYQNRLEHTINNLNTSSENLTAAESRVRDVDMAKEMMEQTKNNILAQAAQAMLAQANQQPQGVLQLLR